MACTIRLAVETAKFGQPEVTIGIIPGYGGTQRLPRLVGKGRALQLIFSADMIDAQEAYRIGLVNEIVAKDNLIPRAEAILNKINANAPTAVKLAIEAANRGLDVSLAEGLNIEASLFTQCFATEDRKEGVAAFQKNASRTSKASDQNGPDLARPLPNRTRQTMNDNIFSGLKVVDFASFIAGPSTR